MSAFVQRPGLSGILNRGAAKPPAPGPGAAGDGGAAPRRGGAPQQQPQRREYTRAEASREERVDRLQQAPAQQGPGPGVMGIREIQQQEREQGDAGQRRQHRERGPPHLQGQARGPQQGATPRGAQQGATPRGQQQQGQQQGPGPGRAARDDDDWRSRSRPASAPSERDQYGGRPGRGGGRGGDFGRGRGRGRGRGGFDRRDVVVKSPREFGIIALLKDDKGFGFIKSPAAVENLFFHASRLINERDWPSDRVRVGDECEFELVADRSGNLSADMVRSAPEGSAVFEKVSATGVSGKIVKDLRKVRSPFGGRNNTVDQFEGRLEYTPEGEGDEPAEPVELPFGFADIDSINAQLWEGDEVTFDVVDDLRFKKRIAANFALVRCSPKDRTTGIVDLVKDGFGFIECSDRPARLFFHFQEILQDEHSEGRMRARTEVEFSVTKNHQQSKGKDKEIAVRVVTLPRGTVKFEEQIAEKVRGKVLKVESLSARQQQQQQRGQHNRFGSRNRNAIQGEIEVQPPADAADAEPYTVSFNGQSVRFDHTLRKDDELVLDVMLDKRAQKRYATNVILVKPAASEKREQGIVESVKETFGFIDGFGEWRKIFFHQSNVLRTLKGDLVPVESGTEVEFDVDTSGTMNRDADPRGQGGQQHEKANALRITVLPAGTIQMVTPVQLQQTGFVSREAQPPGSVRREGERNGRISFGEMPDGTRPTVVYGMTDVEGAKPDEKPEDAEGAKAVAGPDGEEVKVVEVSLVAPPPPDPPRKGEEVTCDIMIDKREPQHRFGRGVAVRTFHLPQSSLALDVSVSFFFGQVVWSEGVVKSAPRATGGFGQCDAPGRELADLTFHWTEQLDDTQRAVRLLTLSCAHTNSEGLIRRLCRSWKSRRRRPSHWWLARR